MKSEINKEFLQKNNVSLKKKISSSPFILSIIAALILIGGIFIENESEAKMPILLFGVIIAIFGIAKFFNTATVLIYEEKKEVMNEEELFFETKAKNDVLEMLRSGEITKLRAEAKDGCNYPLKVELYTTHALEFAIYRVYHFVPYTFEPITEYSVYKKQ